MNTTPPHAKKIPGFKLVSKNRLEEEFHGAQSAYYILFGKPQTSDVPSEQVVLVDAVDDFLEACQHQIDELWSKHRVTITHIAVKLGRPFRTNERNLTCAYERALEIQELRNRLHPQFRRV